MFEPPLAPPLAFGDDDPPLESPVVEPEFEPPFEFESEPPLSDLPAPEFVTAPPLPVVEVPALPPVVNGGASPSVFPLAHARTHATVNDRTGSVNVLAMALFSSA